MKQNLTTQFNHSQQQAIMHKGSPLLLIAGAGSGKTSVIIGKIVYLIEKALFSASQIMAITFSNKAAKEMQSRIAIKRDQLNLRGLKVLTFHALGLKILREDAKLLGYKNRFCVMDSSDSLKLIADIEIGASQQRLNKIASGISLWKNSLISPEDAIANAQNDDELQLANIYEQYQKLLKTYQTIDFDDLIILPLKLFQLSVVTLIKWQQRIGYLLVDEYQDTNLCQYNLVKLLMQNNSNNFMAVGDDDQSIYAWRGANVDNLLNLQRDFTNLTIIKLEQNYRSTLNILNVANSLIKNNKNLFTKRLWSNLGKGELIKICCATTDEKEAEMVVKKILLHKLHNNTDYSDYSILYRSNHQSRLIQQALRSYKIPYTLSGGESFFDKLEIKDMLAYLRLLINEDDDTAFLRCINTPKRGIGEATLDKLAIYAAKREISLFSAMYEEGFLHSCGEEQIDELINFGRFINNLQAQIKRDDINFLLNDLVEAISYKAYIFEQETNESVAKQRFENVLTLFGWISNKFATGKSLLEVINNLILSSMLGEKEELSSSSVRLSTLHAVKGLEFPYVYIINCEDGILPHQESLDIDDIEEERRLMYVGITRAQRELTLSYSLTRKVAGEKKDITRSRFIDEITPDYTLDESLIAHQKIQDSGLLNDRLAYLQSLLTETSL